MINPIVVIILSAYILSFLVLRIVVKPKKPIFTGALLARIFAWIDIGLFAVTIISMYVELRAILISVYSERGKAKNQEIENLTEQTNKSMKGI